MPTEFDFDLEGGLNMLHVIVQHGNRDDRGEGGYGGDGDSEEGELLKALGFTNFFFNVHLKFLFKFKVGNFLKAEVITVVAS